MTIFESGFLIRSFREWVIRVGSGFLEVVWDFRKREPRSRGPDRVAKMGGGR